MEKLRRVGVCPDLVICFRIYTYHISIYTELGQPFSRE